MNAFRQILAFAIVGAVAPIVGNAGAVASSVIAGDPAAHFTFNTVVAPSLAPMVATIPAVLAALITKYVKAAPGNKQLQ